MSDLQKYEGRPIQQEVVQYEGPVDSQSESTPNLIIPILRRWYVVLATFIVVCAIGIPPIWFLVEQKYDTIGAIRISPIISRIIWPDSDSDRPMPNYENFKNTEAARIGGSRVVNRVADQLKDKNLTLFKDINNQFEAFCLLPLQIQ